MTYSYDNNGNTLTKTDSNGTTSYAWDFENRLLSVTLPGTGGTVSFKYDPFGRRIQKSSATGTINYLYDGANVLEEMDGTGSVLAKYSQGAGIDEPLAMLRSGVTSYYQADGLGSVTSLTDTTGALAASYTYDTFGNLTASTGTLTNPFRYTGREFDPETGLYYYRARYYDSNTGRFLSEDPLAFLGGIDFYTAVRNDPVGLIDPAGMLEMVFDVKYKGQTFWQAFPWWENGSTAFLKPQLSYTCDCAGSGKYKLNIKIVFPIRVVYWTEATRRHEERHVQAAEDFFNSNRDRYAAYEKTYDSRTECDSEGHQYVTGYQESGMVPALMQDLLRDFAGPAFNARESSVDSWWDRLIFH